MIWETHGVRVRVHALRVDEIFVFLVGFAIIQFPTNGLRK